MPFIRVSGGRPLSGRCAVQGSKNVGLLLCAAALVVDGPVTLDGVPDVADVITGRRLIAQLGVPVSRASGGLRIAGAELADSEIDTDLGRAIRHTPSFAAAVLACTGAVSFPLPGGDTFCDRPIDLHLEAMRRSGAQLTEQDGRVRARLGGPRPLPIELDLRSPFGPSVGASITAVILASRAAGTSVLRNASIEPEVQHIVNFLRQAGAGIVWKDGTLVVDGVDSLTATRYRTPLDRMEAGTLLIAAAATGGSVSVDGIGFDELPPAFLTWLKRLGAEVSETEHGITLAVSRALVPHGVVTGPHPEFPTDLQPQATALLATLPGRSLVRERVFRRRASHVAGLRALGARITEEDGFLAVEGAASLHGASVTGDDIRCVAALLTAALAAQGESMVFGVEQLARGYEDLPGKLAALGADVDQMADA